MQTKSLTEQEKEATERLISSFEDCTNIACYATSFNKQESIGVKNAIKGNKLLIKYLERLEEMESVIQGTAWDAEAAIKELEKLLEESEDESY